MENAAGVVYEIIDSAQPFVISLVCLAFTVIGIMMAYPSEKTKEKGKAAFPWVLIGCSIALSAVTIGKYFAGKLAF